MVKYIEFGEYNKNYNFIFLTVIFWILFNYLPESLIIPLIKNYNIISEKVEDLYNHGKIINAFLLFGMFIFSCILNKYESKLSKSESKVDNLNSSNLDKGCYIDVKISEEKKREKLINRKNLLNIIIVISICIFTQFLTGIVLVLKIFNSWMVILLVSSFINTKMFNIKIYKHQKCAIAFIFSVLFIFELISFILSMISENDENIYKKYIWLIPIGFIIYCLYVFAFSYSYSKLKWFMDLNWISLSKLLIIYSLIGFLINIIMGVIYSFIKCENENLFCDKEDEKGNYYIENFMMFYKEILAIYRDGYKSDFIIVIFLLFFFHLFYFYIISFFY